MGVDYKANYGIGYRVKASHHQTGEELEDGLLEYLYERHSDRFEVFETGEASYVGGENETFLVVKEPFKGGLYVGWRVSVLDDEVKRLKLVTVGDFGLVGGLLVN